MKSTKSEIRNPKQARNSKNEIVAVPNLGASDLSQLSTINYQLLVNMRQTSC
jgi:hypothetical protein